MADGAIAQPTWFDPYEEASIDLSRYSSVQSFFDYGTKAVMPDLVFYTQLGSDETPSA